MKKILIYDFDGTLTPYSMPKFEILEKCGMLGGAQNKIFLELAQKKASENEIDIYKAIYEVMFEIISTSGNKLTDDNLTLGYDKVKYNKGIESFLNMLCNNGFDNYLLSSGMKVYLENVSISKYFKDIYATTFKYNDMGEIIDTGFLMSDKNKVVAIKDVIRKNGYSEDDCSDIIYVGDGLTDYYAMEYVKENGGITIFVYQDENNENISKMKNIVTEYFETDFSINSKLNNYVKKICKIK